MSEIRVGICDSEPFRTQAAAILEGLFGRMGGRFVPRFAPLSGVAALSGETDLAVLPASELPEQPADGLDWFWLPQAGGFPGRPCANSPAVLFRADNPDARILRSLCLRTVRFVWADMDDADLLSLAGVRELRSADAVLAAASADPVLRALAPQAEWIGTEGLDAGEAAALAGVHVRRGRRVVRLLVGAGSAGRLGEESAVLAQDGIPFRICPGLQPIDAAAGAEGLACAPLGGRRIWIAGAAESVGPLRTAVLDFGGEPVVRPLVRTVATAQVKIRPSKAYGLLAVTAPSVACRLLGQMVSPVQYLPKRLAVPDPDTAAPFAAFNIDTVMPGLHLSAEGLLDVLPEDLEGHKILRIRSEEEGPELAAALKARGARVKDLPICRSEAVSDVSVPLHDAVLLATVPEARAWIALQDRPQGAVIALGAAVADDLRDCGIEPDFVLRAQNAGTALREFAVFCQALEAAHEA